MPLLFFSSCLSFHTHARGLAPQSEEFKENAGYTDLGEAEGKSSQFYLFWLLPVTPRIDFKEAMGEAISSKSEGEALINVRYWHESQYWIVGRIDVLTVKGTVIKFIKKEK